MAEPLKHSIGPTVLTSLAERFEAALPGFDGDRLRRLVGELEARELKERINLVADTIAADRPYPVTLQAVTEVAADDTLDTWAAWPLCAIIERHGIGHPEESLAAMETVTRRFSCEFALRPFLQHHTELTFAYLELWAVHDDEAIRRLVSEGTRPLLPWGERVPALSDNPERAVTLLDHLRLDRSETVRRSVANHLNDVAKIDPDLVMATLDRWDAERPQPDRSLVRHSLRTLVKSGHPDALRLLGFTTDPEVLVDAFDCVPAAIDLGQSIELGATIRSTATQPQRLVIDFAIHHVKANGDTSPKVFKWTTVTLGPGETIELTKTRPIQPISTRVYHPGRHPVDLQIGGKVMATTGFDLRVPRP